MNRRTLAGIQVNSNHKLWGELDNGQELDNEQESLGWHSSKLKLDIKQKLWGEIVIRSYKTFEKVLQLKLNGNLEIKRYKKSLS